MGTQFLKPNFESGELELRYENSIVCIYGTTEGLKKMSELCLELVSNPAKGHVHVGDYNCLTKRSLEGAIAIFGK